MEDDALTDSAVRSPQSSLPLVACLTCTYGRFQRMRECLAFFLAQDYPAKRLFILNNHPVPLRCDLPEVTIFNEPSDEPGIPRNRLLAKVRPGVSTSSTPGMMTTRGCPGISRRRCGRLEGPGPDDIKAAWKPVRSWIRFFATGEYKLNSNNYEASMIVRRDYMAKVGYGIASGNEHRPLLDALKADKALATTEVGARASYIYSWRGDFSHASAALARDMKTGVQDQTLAERDAAWRKLQTDPGDGKTPLTPADIRPRYRDLLAHCRSGLSEYEALELHQLLWTPMNADKTNEKTYFHISVIPYRRSSASIGGSEFGVE